MWKVSLSWRPQAGGIRKWEGQYKSVEDAVNACDAIVGKDGAFEDLMTDWHIWKVEE